jgi:hypothetical protein
MGDAGERAFQTDGDADAAGVVDLAEATFRFSAPPNALRSRPVGEGLESLKSPPPQCSRFGRCFAASPARQDQEQGRQRETEAESVGASSCP